jgi:hypothetical protein
MYTANKHEMTNIYLSLEILNSMNCVQLLKLSMFSLCMCTHKLDRVDIWLYGEMIIDLSLL